MGWLENLKSLINVDVSSLKEVKFTAKIGDISLFKIDRSKNLTINLEAEALKDPKTLQQLEQVVNNALNEDEQPIIEQGASRILDDIASSNNYQETIDFLTGKIPPEDIKILRACTYIRTVHERGDSVDNLKLDIIQRYGPRGANISNLCSTGYFESYIIPMYKEFQRRPNFTPETFIRYYNRIILNAPFAFFVNRTHSSQVAKTKTIAKIAFNKKYGVKDLNIHAMGKENVRKVQALLEDAEVQVLFTSPPDITIEGNVISAQLYYD